MDMFLAIGAPILTGIVLFLIKHIHVRMLRIESTHMPKEDIRTLIEDKMGGIRSDIKDIKNKIEKLFDLYIAEHKK